MQQPNATRVRTAVGSYRDAAGPRPRLLAAVVRSKATWAFAAERQVVRQAGRAKESQVGILRSYLTAVRVSGRFGRATKLEREGRAAEALAVARGALSLLRAPHVVRNNPAESSVLVSLTVLIERLSFELRQPGSDLIDLRESVRALESLGDGGSGADYQMRDEWLRFLRSRLEKAGGA